MKKMKLWKKIVLVILALAVVAGIAGFLIRRHMLTPERIGEAQGKDKAIVETEKGDIRGSMENGIYQYLGVPYAQAEERFVPRSEERRVGKECRY